jgi:hypothetical protein
VKNGRTNREAARYILLFSLLLLLSYVQIVSSAYICSNSHLKFTSVFLIESSAYVIRCYKNCFHFIVYEFCFCGPLNLLQLSFFGDGFWVL